MQGFGGEFAHQSEVVILRLANKDMSFRRNAQEFSPPQYTLVHAAVRIRSPLHGEHAACQASFRIERANCVRQHAVFQAESRMTS
jgi:hypothetical protein